MSTKTQMEELLENAFSPVFMEVRDVSEAHSGHTGARSGGETHFEVDITSAIFAGKSRVQSHRLVHEILQPLLRTTIHALALNIKSS
tara:strand:+ start:367 stop:627 length:261 start_codon:yes stop_codon:yes gene_type:complete